jgi:hypothetical protein
MGTSPNRSRIDNWIRRLRKSAGIGLWNALTVLQTSNTLNSSSVIWNSRVDVSHIKSSSRLGPYLCRLQRTALIEPLFGFAIADFGLLIETSVTNSYVARDPFLNDFFSLPSPAAYFKARFFRHYRSDLEEVALLCSTWPFNYFHFYRDFLPKVLLLEEANIDPGLPVVVPDALFDQPFFQEAIRSKRLSRWTFVSPRGQFLRCKSVVFCSGKQFIVMDRSKTSEAELLERSAEGVTLLESPADILALLDLEDSVLELSAQRRIFLTRGASRGRTLSNFDEIEPLLRKRNFEIVDTEKMTLREQALLFRECRYLIGLHGAGLANIIHAHDHDLSLLELRQPGEEHLVTDFALMCHAYGFRHGEIFGTSESDAREPHQSGVRRRDEAFRIDVSLFEAAVDRMLLTTNSD